MKVRTIVDTKESGVKWITAKTQRVILPRLFDAVLTLLMLLAINTDAGCTAATVGAFVLDFSEAFWQIPICREEQRFFCATATVKGRRKYVAFKRAAQGSANAPMLWGRVAALICRLCQGLFQLSVLNLMCYVDDPLAAIRGTPEERQLHVATLILVWEALGCAMAYHKGQLTDFSIDNSITWIGGTLTATPDGVHARVKAEIISDICGDLKRILKLNVLPLKELHSLLGKLGHCASLLVVMRPFLEPLWAALYDVTPSSAPANTVWVKQILSSLRWFNAFFTEPNKPLMRFYSLDAYLRRGTIVEIGTDASPYGMGGWIMVDGVIKHFFSCPISDHDVEIFDMPRGTADGQQLWECLAILIAVDIWSSLWLQNRIILKVKADNVGALTLLIKMRPGSSRIAIVARELALRLVELSFPPDALHTPGVAHVIADRLSRVFAPRSDSKQPEVWNGAAASCHPALADATETPCPTRNKAWYKALD